MEDQKLTKFPLNRNSDQDSSELVMINNIRRETHRMSFKPEFRSGTFRACSDKKCITRNSQNAFKANIYSRNLPSPF